MNLKSNFVCQQCGYSQVGWSGKCPECGAWGSLVETVEEIKKNQKAEGKKGKEPVLLTSVSSKGSLRISTKISELDRVLGGGLVKGQVILLAGEPGIGKSTLLLQLSDKIGETLYVSGEESVHQIKLRAQRLSVKRKTIRIMEETDTDNVVSWVKEKGKKGISLIVVDSIQTMTTSDLSGMAGSVGQVRECAYRFVRLAKIFNIPVVLVGHVTKEGTVAGPAVLAHIVDSVLWFEGDKSLTLRMLRAVKNRFGPTDEVGIFSMEDKGLVSMGDPEKIFLTKTRRNVPGSVISSILSGSRPILVEVQSLIVPSRLAFPKRIAQGIDSRRLEILIAVLTKCCGLPLYEYDVFVNIAGGMTVRDPGVDLAICLSIASAFFNKPLDSKTIVLGEVGLLGEIREVVAQEKRIKEAKRLGYKNLITSKNLKHINQAIKKYLR